MIDESLARTIKLVGRNYWIAQRVQYLEQYYFNIKLVGYLLVGGKVLEGFKILNYRPLFYYCNYFSIIDMFDAFLVQNNKLSFLAAVPSDAVGAF
jgi:hypothetical protein